MNVKHGSGSRALFASKPRFKIQRDGSHGLGTNQ